MVCAAAEFRHFPAHSSGFHIAAICLTGALVLYADEQGLAWMLGKKDRLNQNVVHFMHYAVAVGLAQSLLPARSFYSLEQPSIRQPDFIVK